MWLVLCHTDDLAALWAWEGLRRRGLEPLELVTAEVLSCALHWNHLVGAEGASVEIQLAGGRRIASGEVRGALNRLQTVPIPFWRSAEEKDRDYVLQELNAFYTSWIYSLPGRVLNPASASGLCGTWRHRSAWTRLAVQAGLDAVPFHSSGGGDVHSTETVIVVNDEAVHPCAPPAVAAGCQRLAKLADTPLLGIGFAAGPEGQWLFAGATAVPDLRAGGEPLLDALAAALREPS